MCNILIRMTNVNGSFVRILKIHDICLRNINWSWLLPHVKEICIPDEVPRLEHAPTMRKGNKPSIQL